MIYTHRQRWVCWRWSTDTKNGNICQTQDFCIGQLIDIFLYGQTCDMDIDWLLAWLLAWLIDWLIDWLTDWLFDWEMWSLSQGRIVWVWIIILHRRSFIYIHKVTPLKLANCKALPNLWSQTCVHCWYLMYIWIASDWYSVSAQQVGGQVHRTHCLALKSRAGCLLQQPIMGVVTWSDLTVNGGGVGKSPVNMTLIQPDGVLIL